MTGYISKLCNGRGARTCVTQAREVSGSIATPLCVMMLSFTSPGVVLESNEKAPVHCAWPCVQLDLQPRGHFVQVSMAVFTPRGAREPPLRRIKDPEGVYKLGGGVPNFSATANRRV